ncbi:hypothetical protein HDU97_008166 [Phlyctochytrium planicorne]|nr:hypothetical protein HDU97_008166 [Phlyctochytrium planicorne]
MGDEEAMHALHNNAPNLHANIPVVLGLSIDKSGLPIPQYKTLGVSRKADQKEIKKAYLAKVLENHPDRFQCTTKAESKRRKETFQRIVQSFEILSSPNKRQLHDLESSSPSYNASSSTSSSTYRHNPTTGRTPSGQSWGQAYGQETEAWGYNDPAFWRGDMNRGPIYMSNGKMAAIIIGVGVVMSLLMVQLTVQRSSNMIDSMNRRDDELKVFYEERKRRAAESGFEEATRPLRERARIIEEEERAERLKNDSEQS